MEFDLNDPLGDILSDDDSFFNDEKYTKTSTKSRKSSTADINTKKSNIFGLETESSLAKESKYDPPLAQTKKAESDWLGLIDSSPNTPNVEKKSNYTKSTKVEISHKMDFKTDKVDSNEGIDLLEHLGLPDDLDYKKPMGKSSKENLTLDEILNKSSIGQQKSKEDDISNLLFKKDKTPTYTPSISSGLTEKKDKKPFTFSDPEPKKSTIISRDVTKSSNLLTNPIAPRSDKKDSTFGTTRQRKEKKDWLGLLQDESDGIFETDDVHKKKSFSELLNLNDSKIDNNSNTNTIKNTPENTSKINEIDSNRQVIKPINVENNQTRIENPVNKSILPNINDNIISNLSTNLLDIEQNSAALCLQQQESHLLVALQLKAQEERLSNMHDKQKETRRIQNEVVSAYKEQQDSIINGIKEHQQRINQHIKTLLFRGEDTENSKYLDNTAKEENHERNHFEYIITVLKDNHEKEIEILHTSHQRQINSITESQSAIEERYKNEQEKLTHYYLTKINSLEMEIINMTEKYDVGVKYILEKQLTERDRTEHKHFNDIEVLQKQHETIVNNIKEAYAQEQSTIHETKDYSKQLNAVLSDVERNNGMCEKIVEKLESITTNNIEMRQSAMQVKEEQINRLLDHLEKQKDVYYEETLKTKNVLSIIEERLKQQTEIIDEEKLSLKHKQHAFEVEQERVMKEYEGMKKQLEFDREIFKKNCENVERTHSEQKSHIDEETRKFEKERNVIVEEKKMLSIMKTECQELKKNLNMEIEKLNDKKKSLQQENDRICQEEMNILQRSRELEILARGTVAKQKIAENKVSEANYAQKQYEEKLSKIQEYSLSLNAREQQIAKEKISLSKERLLLYNEQKSSVLPKRLTQFNNEVFPRFHDMDSHNIFKNYHLDSSTSKDFYNDDVLNNSVKMINLNTNGSKDVKDDFNILEQINNMEDQVSLRVDYVEKLPNVFQDIVDPKIMAMKFDINNCTTNDPGPNLERYNYVFSNL